jgi:hypothetical protein
LGNARATSGEFIMRDGETVLAILNNDLTTKLSQQGDLFTMTVRDPPVNLKEQLLKARWAVSIREDV